MQQKLSILLTILLIVTLLFIPQKTAQADNAFEQVGKVKFDGVEVGEYRYNGQLAFCIQFNATDPSTGSQYNDPIVINNEQIRRALYYGYSGPGDIFGSREQGIVVTTLVLSTIYSGSENGQNVPGYSELLDLANNGSIPEYEAHFSTEVPKIYIEDDIQKTNTITLEADETNSFEFDLPAGVNLQIVDGETDDGRVSITGGDEFYLFADKSYDTPLTLTDVQGSVEGLTAKIIEPTTNLALQTLALSDTYAPDKVSLYAPFGIPTTETSIKKTAEDGVVEGAKFRIYNDSFDQTVSTDSEGEVTVALPDGTYTVVEVDTPRRYVQPSSQTLVIPDDAAEGLTFDNKLIRFNLEVTKEDVETRSVAQGQATLKGAIYGLFRDGKLVKTGTTDSKGKFTLEDLVYSNDYAIEEINPSEGYLLDEGTYDMPMPDNLSHGAIITAKLYEKVIRGGIRVEKTNDEEEKLNGAEFDVIEDSNGNGKPDDDDKTVGRLVKNDNGVFEANGLPYGGYFLKEVKAPEGYVVDEKPYYFKIAIDGEILMIETVPGKGFVNKRQTGSLRLTKTSSDGKTEGFSFTVKGEKFEEEFTTNSDGVIYLTNLLPGTYTISENENEATVDYVIPDDQSATITYNEVTEVHFYNDKFASEKLGRDKTISRLAQTGDIVLPLMAFLTVGAVIAFTVYYSRKRKAEKI